MKPFLFLVDRLLREISLIRIISIVLPFLAVSALTFGLYDYMHKSPVISNIQLWAIFLIPISTILITFVLLILELKNKQADIISKLENDIKKRINEIKIQNHLSVSEAKIGLLLIKNDTIITSEVSRLIKEFGKNIDLLAMGRFYEYQPESFYNFAINKFQYAQTSVKATSSVKTDFWNIPEGITYLEDNKKLIVEKSLTITRYFIFTESLNDTEKANFKKIISAQIDAKIDVRVANLTDKSLMIDRGYEDIGLIDEQIAIIDTYDKERGLMIKCDCYYNNDSNDIRKVKAIFTALGKNSISGQEFLNA